MKLANSGSLGGKKTEEDSPELVAPSALFDLFAPAYGEEGMEGPSTSLDKDCRGGSRRSPPHRDVLPGSGAPGARGVLTEKQESQDPLKHRRGLQPPRQRDVERRKLDLHGPTPAKTAQPVVNWNLAAVQSLWEVRGRVRAPRRVPAGRRVGGGCP